MEIRQLQHFIATADSGSFSKASSILGIAQPALSRQIQQLEQELGTQLFYRHGRGVRLTEDGSRFRKRIAPLLREFSEAGLELLGSSGVPSGAISFGMPPSMTAAIGAPVVQIFLEYFEHADLRIVDGFSGYINEWLVAGRIDMAIINGARR